MADRPILKHADFPDVPPGFVVLTEAEFKMLMQAAEADDCMTKCETCGAWMSVEEPECASTEDYTGCWKMATDDPRFQDMCLSHRVTRLERPLMKEPTP